MINESRSIFTTADILDSNVTTAKIADSAVTTIKIPDSNITVSKIASGAATNSKIADNAVTAVKIADLGITYPMRESITISKSSSSGAFLSTSASYVDITNLSITLTTTGRPVFMGLTVDESKGANITSISATIAFDVDGSNVAVYDDLVNNNLSSCTSFWCIRSLSSGSHTIKVRGKKVGTHDIKMQYVKLVVYELY